MRHYRCTGATAISTNTSSSESIRDEKILEIYEEIKEIEKTIIARRLLF